MYLKDLTFITPLSQNSNFAYKLIRNFLGIFSPRGRPICSKVARQAGKSMIRFLSRGDQQAEEIDSAEVAGTDFSPAEVRRTNFIAREDVNVSYRGQITSLSKSIMTRGRNLLHLPVARPINRNR